jgi:transposase
VKEEEMPARRLSMKKTKDILKLAQETDLTNRQIARSLNVSPTTVAECVKRAEAVGVVWPLTEDMDEEAIEALLYPEKKAPTRPLPEWKCVHRELSRKGVTLMLLWQEYEADNTGDHYSYSQFARRYAAWTKKLDVAMRQVHKAGEKLFSDFAGHTLPIVEAATGEISQAHLFVCSLGFSNYTYAEAFASEQLPCWIAGHVRAFAHFGAAPEIIVPDNPRAIVTKADRYEPELNRTFEDMASHYSCAIIPARVRTPKDKAKVESAVLQAERWILAPLRNRTFHSVHDANIAIAERLEWLNDRRMRGMDASRAELFETVDRPAMLTLPEHPYEFATWKKARVNIDYHIEIEGHYYSVPYHLVREKVDVRLTDGTIEVFHRGKRVASHPRSFTRGQASTTNEHRPASHKAYLQWTPSRIISWAQETGPATAALVEEIMRSKPHPEMGYRSCLGIIRLADRFGPERTEAASGRALACGACSYRSVKSILQSGLDRLNEQDADRPAIPPHENVRGPDYYN